MRKYMTITIGALVASAIPFTTAALAADATIPAPLQFVAEQPANEYLARVFLGSAVQNPGGEALGDVRDLVFDHSGHISTVVLGVGGFLGMGQRNVAVPFTALTFSKAADGTRLIVVALGKEALKAAPPFKAIEKTTYDTVKDEAVELGKQATDKAVQLKDATVKKVDEMRK